ncbi:hypothetical protein BESB_039030 [Besnoitia besnoiti]|uniref:Uncharacterized protein n=1 Tax=Besnoitia besnoiti TaxID=94643 RepID=A0A2A9MHJ6_BESBE|nr:hypothetical protein BESB_039030 [Besnoitia besnoiti]PFH37445.1 hypothetical protein BESB_039030 [Besnoitia besnoiti]
MRTSSGGLRPRSAAPAGPRASSPCPVRPPRPTPHNLLESSGHSFGAQSEQPGRHNPTALFALELPREVWRLHQEPRSSGDDPQAETRQEGISGPAALPHMERLVLHHRVECEVSAYIRELLATEQGRQALRATLHHAVDMGLFDVLGGAADAPGEGRRPGRPWVSGVHVLSGEEARRDESEARTGGVSFAKESVCDPFLHGFLSQCGAEQRHGEEEEDRPHLLQDLWKQYVLPLQEELPQRTRGSRGESAEVGLEGPHVCRLRKNRNIVYVPYTPYKPHASQRRR